MPNGPTTSIAPYLTASNSNVRLSSIVTAGDALPRDGVFAGVPDGLAAFDNGNGTISVLIVHQLASSVGLVRDHGTTGSFIDRLVIDKATLQVTFADDLIQTVMRWSDSKDIHYAGLAQLSKLSCADLADASAYYNSASGLGTNVPILLTGEESGAGGSVFATVVSGAGAGVSWELPFLGNMAFETAIANPFAQDLTIVALTDDTTGGQVYFYVGAKQASGSDVAKAGLMNGDLFGLKVTGLVDELNGTPINGQFTLQEIGPAGDASNMTGAQIEIESDAEGVTGFLRPEDAVWDPANPNILYFVTTASFGGNSRLYRATFTDISRPQLGGTIDALLVGDEGHRMLDNIEISGGRLILQEDPGNNAYLARVWEYDIATDSLTPLAQFDQARFAPGSPAYITQYEESSGVLDVTDLLGDADTRAYLVTAQLHVPTGDPATVEMGQLMLMQVDTPISRTVTFDHAVDTYIREARPLSTYGTATLLQIDGDDGQTVQTLLAFKDMFGDGPGQIPLGATITSAMLTLTTTNASRTGVGIYRMTVAWGQNSTWSSLGNGVQIGTETYGTADLTVVSTGIGARSFDVTSSVAAWMGGASTVADANRANEGWAFIANGIDGWDFSSAEGSAGPALTVTYTVTSNPFHLQMQSAYLLEPSITQDADAWDRGARWPLHGAHEIPFGFGSYHHPNDVIFLG